VEGKPMGEPHGDECNKYFSKHLSRVKKLSLKVDYEKFTGSNFKFKKVLTTRNLSFDGYHQK
jgi:hypothetical protein